MKYINLNKQPPNANPSDNSLLGQQEENYDNRTVTSNRTASELISKLNQSIEKQQDYRSNIPKSYKTFQKDDFSLKKGSVSSRIKELNRAVDINNNPESASARIAAINARLASKE